MQLNEIHFAGYLGKDADTRTTQSGDQMTTFSLCHSRTLKNGNKESTWVNVRVYGSWVSTAQGLKKGDNVFVSGMLNVSQYKDKNGVDRTSVSILARSLGVFVPKASEPSQNTTSSVDLDDDIPF